MPKRVHISRRDFLKIVGVNLSAFAFPNLPGMLDWAAGWPRLSFYDLPPAVREILNLVPNTILASNGNMHLLDRHQVPIGQIPIQQTRWNLERSKPQDELFPDLRWGIVLHWYGDPEYFDQTVKGYLRGFNHFRRIADHENRTSAHFLVGDKLPKLTLGLDEDFQGILQTQSASSSGVPYLASHLNNYYVNSFDGDHYFVNTLYKLGLVQSPIDPVLSEIFEGPKVDPNFRTIAVEITGFDFDSPEHLPSNQKIANVLSVVWAIMKRYRIRAIDILGHNEIQLTNSDPGKKFLGLIRYLIGVMALTRGDALMCFQVFGPFLEEDAIPANAVIRYFEYVRSYLVLVGMPKTVFEWEAWSKYWFVFDKIAGLNLPDSLMTQGHHPLRANLSNLGNWYLDPDNHEGIDIYPAGVRNEITPQAENVRLVANGTCLYLGENRGFHHGKAAIFRHRQPNGSQLLTVYGHMNELGEVEVGKCYPSGYRLGRVGGMQDGTHAFLHFSSAYGATWDKHLEHNPNVPMSANARWIEQYYFHPEILLNQLIS